MGKIKKSRSVGSILGLTSGVFWGLNSVILGLVLVIPGITILGPKNSLIITLFHDFVSFILLFLILIEMKSVKKMISVLFSKSGLSIVLAALLGGPIGMGAYITAINYLGPTLAASGSAVYPAIGAILAYLILNRKMKLHSILGFIIAIGSIAMMGMGSIGIVANLGLGLLFLIVCVFGWGSEAVIIDAALTENVPSEIALAIRQLTTFTVYSLFVIPSMGFNTVLITLSTQNVILLSVLASVAGTLSYLAYYKSIDLIGATQAMGLNISYPAWAFIFQFLVDGTFSVFSFVLVIFIIVGSIMSNDNPRDFIQLFKR